MRNLPDPGDTFAAVHGDEIVFATAMYDQNAENPLENWDGMGSILSLGRRHVNFDPDGVQRALAETPQDVVALGYYEHGNCRWFVAGEAPPGADCRWDGVAFAGVWLPDADTLKEANTMPSDLRHPWLRARAREVCDVYTAYCNGEVYGYDVAAFKLRTTEEGEHYTERSDYRFDTPEREDQCFGFYGYDHFMKAFGEALDAVEVQEVA